MIRIYISGPMTGLPDFNRKAFNTAEDALRMRGYNPLNPARNGLPENSTYEEHMRADLRMLLEADAVAVLPGWEQSKGAQLETRLAAFLGMPIRPISAYIEGEFTGEGVS